MMKRWILLAVAGALFAGCIGAGRNIPVGASKEGYFPSLVGIDLFGRERRLPGGFSGSLNLVVIAFERKQQKQVDTWIEYFAELGEKYSGLRLYELPLIYRLNAPYRFWINNGMRAGIQDLAARERTITVYTDRERFLEIMDMQTTGIYALLLDSEGRILWRVQGESTLQNRILLTKALQGLHP